MGEHTAAPGNHCSRVQRKHHLPQGDSSAGRAAGSWRPPVVRTHSDTTNPMAGTLVGWGSSLGHGPWDAQTWAEEAISSSGKPAEEQTPAACRRAVEVRISLPAPPALADRPLLAIADKHHAPLRVKATASARLKPLLSGPAFSRKVTAVPEGPPGQGTRLLARGVGSPGLCWYRRGAMQASWAHPHRLWGSGRSTSGDPPTQCPHVPKLDVELTNPTSGSFYPSS